MASLARDPGPRRALLHELKLQDLQYKNFFGVNGAQIASDLWSFLLRWIGPRLYLRRTKMSHGIEGNGLELWRKLFSEYQGSDELVRMAGRAKLLDFEQCKSTKNLNHHIDE